MTSASIRHQENKLPEITTAYCCRGQLCRVIPPCKDYWFWFGEAELIWLAATVLCQFSNTLCTVSTCENMHTLYFRGYRLLDLSAAFKATWISFLFFASLLSGSLASRMVHGMLSPQLAWILSDGINHFLLRLGQVMLVCSYQDNFVRFADARVAQF